VPINNDRYRLKTSLEQCVTGKFNNKLIIMDNASCHRNPEIKHLVQKDNKLLFSVFNALARTSLLMQ
jgi:hypothetical protein